MGCLFTGPLQKTSGPHRAPASSTYSTTGGSQNPFGLYNSMDQSNDSNNQSAQLKFFSFSEFIQQSENPTIFEWSFQKEIGKGAMSRVFMSTHTETGIKCAAKVYNKTLLMRQTLGNEEQPIVAVNREIEIMVSLAHRYILPIVEVIEDECTNSLIMLLPFAPEGTLQSFIDKSFPSEQTFKICFFQLAEAFRYTHSMNIVHRDLKPDNILVFSDTLFKLSDFSVSTKVESDDEKLADTRGSPAFLSPEECAGNPFYPKPADVWAYGVTMFGCVYGFLPFSLDKGQGKSVANTVFAVTQLLNSEELFVPEDRGYSPHLAELLKQILQKDPEKRPTFEEIVKSPWFEGTEEIDRQYIEEFEQNYANFEEEEEEGEELQDGAAAQAT
ncbi:CAMK family protein kinase [Tritrichomonas foetus]|uniref:CAMK family protein kinase n=1 Tax=Tritrichomonas foetus TaxID=1144522 RepID=A0A1J4KH99_9EUKA|nr:CAMK family protein kinase [Tritrichomonas foetus]|eukprot:OHT08717.1 CAMK family protein kinase [Tritrichomonas foetus]